MNRKSVTHQPSNEYPTGGPLGPRARKDSFWYPYRPWLRVPIRLLGILLLCVGIWRFWTQQRFSVGALWLPLLFLVTSFEHPRLVPKTLFYRVAIVIIWLLLAAVCGAFAYIYFA